MGSPPLLLQQSQRNAFAFPNRASRLNYCVAVLGVYLRLLQAITVVVRGREAADDKQVRAQIRRNMRLQQIEDQPRIQRLRHFRYPSHASERPFLRPAVPGEARRDRATSPPDLRPAEARQKTSGIQFPADATDGRPSPSRARMRRPTR